MRNLFSFNWIIVLLIEEKHKNSTIIRIHTHKNTNSSMLMVYIQIPLIQFWTVTTQMESEILQMQKKVLQVHLQNFLTLTRFSRRFLHTSFLSDDIMSDFFSNTRYLLKKSGYVHLDIAQHLFSCSLCYNLSFFSFFPNKNLFLKNSVSLVLNSTVTTYHILFMGILKKKT